MEGKLDILVPVHLEDVAPLLVNCQAPLHVSPVKLEVIQDLQSKLQRQKAFMAIYLTNLQGATGRLGICMMRKGQKHLLWETAGDIGMARLVIVMQDLERARPLSCACKL